METLFVPRAGIEPARTYNIRGILSPLCLPVSPPRQWGVDQIRTGEWQFCRLLPYHLGTTPKKSPSKKRGNRAKERIRTVDPHVGNVMLYQLSYFRNKLSPKIENNIMLISVLNQDFFNDRDYNEGLLEVCLYHLAKGHEVDWFFLSLYQ